MPLLLGWLFSWFSPASAADLQQQSVREIRLGIEGNRTRLVLDLSAPVSYRVKQPSLSGRLIVEIDGVTLTNDPPATLFRHSAVTGLQRDELESGGLRLGFTLANNARLLREFTLGPNLEAGRGHRLVLDIVLRDDAEAASAGPAPVTQGGNPRQSGGAGQAQRASAASTGTSGPDLEPTVDAAVATAPSTEPAALANPVPEGAPSDTAESGGDELDAFFDLDDPEAAGPQLGGYLETSAAYTTSAPEHWSKLRARLELALSGDLGDALRYKIAARLDGDGAYVVEDDFYPGPVRDDQRFEAQIREFYLDFGSGAWAHRVGRQHIVWGEMVGLFLADVVSARDTREFFLQEFEAMRIPQWAWNAQYFAGESTVELVYIPFQSVDNIGEPGADFYPFPLPGGTPVRDERPDRSLSDFNWGVRASTLRGGWSLSGYYYDSVSVAPTLVAEESGFALQYDDIEQIGATFSKDFGGFVFKGEAVYVRDRRFQSLDPAQPTALMRSGALDWVVGTTIPRGDWRWDLQLYGRRTGDHDARMGFDANEYGATVLVNYAASSRVELELLALAGLNREDYLLRPKLAWRFARDWRLQAGADIFGGDAIGLFGPYDNRDRVFLEIKRWF